MPMNRINIVLFLTFVFTTLSVAAAQSFDVSWYTIDGGGATFSTGGAFQLGGTIGQFDAGPTPMTGGAFTLTGGFWPGAGDVCPLLGDMNADGQRDGFDVQNFVNCLLGVGGGSCPCADLDGSGTLNNVDAAQFVQMLLS